MNLSARIEQARSLCQQALTDSYVAHAEHFFARRGLTEQARIELLQASARSDKATPQLLALRDWLESESGLAAESGVFERALLVRAALPAIDQISKLPVDETVKHLYCKEFAFYAKPPESAHSRFSLQAYPFIAMSKIVLLKSFPAGPLHWEASGFPRSWFVRVAPQFMARTYQFLALKTRGFKPFFVPHLAATRQKQPFLIEREYFAAFYRAAMALEKQPPIKALMAGSWLHSVETHRVSPHLSFMNRPYIEAGGIYTDLGPASPNDGFLAGSKERAELYHAGKYKPTFGVVMCTSKQAIAWKRAHPEIEPLLAVK